MIAIIDIGSNTIRLSVYERGEGDNADGNAFNRLSKIKRTAGLASHIDANGALSQEGIAAMLEVLTEFKEMLSSQQLSKICVIAGAALRNITNTRDVCAAIERHTGFCADVLSGIEEAMCGAACIFASANVQSGIILDIGGGSTEVVHCANGAVQHAESLPIGTLNMYSKYVTRVLPSYFQMQKIFKYARKMFRKSNPQKLTSPIIFGIGGVMRTLYKLNNAIFNMPSNNMTVDIQNVNGIIKLLRTDTRRTVNLIIQITPERIHTITPGLLILSAAAEVFGSEKMIVSESGVSEGYLLRSCL